MNFADCLKQYMTDIPCSASELAAVSGLAPSMISRYLRSEQTPGEKAVRRIASGLDFLSRDKGGPSLDHEKVCSRLKEALSGIRIDYDRFVMNLQRLLSEMNISNNELAKSLSFDPSYISRILAGTRRPADVYGFLCNVSDYTAQRFYGTPYLPLLADLIQCSRAELQSHEMISFSVRRFLGSGNEADETVVRRFLSHLEAYSAGEKNAGEMTALYDRLHSSSDPGQGIIRLRQAELDFLSAASDPENAGDVTLYSDMPLEELFSDPDFSEEWSRRIAALLANGQTIRKIHNVHRSFSDMVLDLDHWIPHYLCGRVQPWYLKEPTGGTFLHLIRSSGRASLTGEAIRGTMDDARFFLSTSPEEVAYTHHLADALLSMAQPLMTICTETEQDQFRSLCSSLTVPGGSYQLVLTAPPVFSMPPDLFGRICTLNGISATDAGRIRFRHHQIWSRLEEALMGGDLTIVLPAAAEDEERALALPGQFLPKKLVYGKGQYEEHLACLWAFAKARPSVKIVMKDRPLFRNIELLLAKGRSVLVSRNAPPELHVLIHYPKMVQAIEDLFPAED